MATHPHFEIFVGKDGQYYLHLTASNGEIILSGEGYTTKDNCRKGIESILIHARTADNFKKHVATNGKFYFTLQAANNQTVGTSQLYDSAQSRDAGIESVMLNAPMAGMDDIT